MHLLLLFYIISSWVHSQIFFLKEGKLIFPLCFKCHHTIHSRHTNALWKDHFQPVLYICCHQAIFSSSFKATWVLNIKLKVHKCKAFFWQLCKGSEFSAASFNVTIYSCNVLEWKNSCGICDSILIRQEFYKQKYYPWCLIVDEGNIRKVMNFAQTFHQSGWCDKKFSLWDI